MEGEGAVRVYAGVDLGEILGFEGEVVRNVVLAHDLTDPADDGASFLGDMPHRQEPRLTAIPGWSHMDLCAPRCERVTCQRHVVLPADQPAYTAEWQLIHSEIASVAATPHQALAPCRN